MGNTATNSTMVVVVDVVVILIVLAKLLIISELFATASSTSLSNDDLYNFSCGNYSGNHTSNSFYQASLYYLIGNLTTEASATGFYQASHGQNQDQVFAVYMCRGDIDNKDCNNCVTEATNTILTKCPYQTGAIIWYDLCIFRFSNESFFGRMDETPEYVSYIEQNVSANQQNRFSRVLGDTMKELAVQAASDNDHHSAVKKFATKVLHFDPSLTLYALVQCIPDLTASDCNRCLTNATGQLNSISIGNAVALASCNVRYEIYPFFNLQVQAADSSSLRPSPASKMKISQNGKKQRLLLRISVSLAIPISITILLGVVICICNYKRKQKARETNKIGTIQIRDVDSLQFDLNKLRAATHNFSIDNKLGQGGFGEVYKGILEDGREIAIKRLSKNSGQGIEEFKTEVDLVANLQHKNLVKLLGFCLSSTEKILVYELMQNSSLDQFLFDATKKASLDWDTRYKLIVGIGRGLLYLHEDSRLKIIHRDLKPSNILLDQDMNPKISDFGLAKLFGVDQTQDDTKRIVGTYGYMAPEYMMTGHFSVKSDVYSFGIILLEIVSGQRNRFFGRHQIEEAMLHRAWRLWNESKALDLVDTTLFNKYPRKEATKCIHIALLCIQENATERPRMATVVAALNGQSISLPMPKPPNFFGNVTTTHEIPTEVEYRQELDRRHSPGPYSGTETVITDDIYHPR